MKVETRKKTRKQHDKMKMLQLQTLVRKQQKRIEQLESMVKFNNMKARHFFGKPIMLEEEWLDDNINQ